MIAEAILYAATLPFTVKAHRKFIRASVSLRSRARRCGRDWAEHEALSQKAVLDAMQGLRQRRTVVVLGSGLLRDVPISALARAFDTVVLVDLVHLASVRLWLKAKGLRNVRLVERDLSGFDEVAAGMTPEPLDFLRQVPYLDLVISANLLSQIGMGIKSRLEAKAHEAMPADTGARVISAHLDGLAGLPCAACLITDIAYAVVDRVGKTHETEDLLFGVAPPKSASSWSWPVVPFGEESKNYQVVHQVIAARMQA